MKSGATDINKMMDFLPVENGLGVHSSRSQQRISTPSRSSLSAMERLQNARNGTKNQENRQPIRPRPASDTVVVPPYCTVGQLSYAPATQTTVVTTTTTTTTSFPPIFLKAPGQLHQRDPKVYPLAASPTPQALKRFCFDVAGKPACFQEADDVEDYLNEFDKEQASLQSSNGLLRSITCSKINYKPGVKHIKGGPPCSMNVSYADKHHLPNKKLVPTQLCMEEELEYPHTNSCFTPLAQTSDTSSYGSSIFPPGLGIDTKSSASPSSDEPHNANDGTRLSSGGKNSRISTAHDSSCKNCGGSCNHHLYRETPKSTLDRHSSDTELARQETALRYPVYNASLNTTCAPSTVEGDEVVKALPGSQHIYAQRQRPPRPTPLETGSVQDVSLPSPSLSPTTAAATHVSHSYFDNGQSGAKDRNWPVEFYADAPLESRPGPHRITSNSSANDRRKEEWDGAASDSKSYRSSGSAMDIPTMLDCFDAMADEMKTYVMYQFLRRCAKPTLHFVAEIVNPALKCDFLDLLPLELSMNIVKYLDAKTMCRAAQVSKKWRHIINSDEKAWKDLLERDGYCLSKRELERAVKEGWGWQFPSGTDNWEKDLSGTVTSKSDSEVSASSLGIMHGCSNSEDHAAFHMLSKRPKRKAAARFPSQKRPKRKASLPTKSHFPNWLQTMEKAQGPNACASAAARAVPDPNIGLSSLKGLHLFKSIYQRHHLIRRGWMVEDVKPHHIAFGAHQNHVVTCLQFDSEKILTGSDDTNINVYDTQTGALRSQLKGHGGGVWALQYEGNILVSGSTDRSVRVWDIEQGKCLQVFQGHTSTVRCLVILKPTQVGISSDGSAIMMPQEPLIITGSRDSTLRIWKLPQVGDRSIIQTGASENDQENPYFVRALTGHQYSVRAIAAHGDTLVSGSYDFSVRVWKISTGEIVHRLQGHSQKVYSVVLDNARNRCISGSMDNIVKVWSLETGACIFNLEGHTSLVGLLDLSHDRLVSAAADSTLRIWDPENGQCKSTLSAHTGAITCFQHDGQKVISGSDRTLKMWNVKTGECVKDLLTDLSGVWQVKFNDRRCVAAVQRDNLTYIEVLDFGAMRDGVPAERLGRRILVNAFGKEVEEMEDIQPDSNLSAIEDDLSGES